MQHAQGFVRRRSPESDHDGGDECRASPSRGAELSVGSLREGIRHAADDGQYEGLLVEITQLCVART
jgi:hypothetical protein